MEAQRPASPQLEGRLAVREEAGAFLVVRETDPEDWLARFEKADGFAAREWAHNMVRVYNRRQALRFRPPERSGPSLSDHPTDEGRLYRAPGPG